MGCRIAHDRPRTPGLAPRPEFHALEMPRDSRGEIHDVLLDCERLPGMRLLRIYVPAPNLRGPHPLPTLLVNDGRKAFEPSNHRTIPPWQQSGTLQLHRVMDGMLCDNTLRPAVVVAIATHSGSRANQYVPVRARHGDTEFGGLGDAYLDLLEHEVLPAVERVLPGVPFSREAADRVLMGTSIGGVSALHGAMARPGVFGGAIALSPSAWIDDGFLLRMAQANGPLRARIAADIGAGERTPIREHCRRLFDHWNAAGDGQVLAGEVDGIHNEDSWRTRLPRLLRHVFGRHQPTDHAADPVTDRDAGESLQAQSA